MTSTSVLFVWTQVTGYLADSLRSLRDEGVQVGLVARSARAGLGQSNFSDDLIADATDYCRLVDGEVADAAAEAVLHLQPDVVVVPGWNSGRLIGVIDALVPRTRQICALDTSLVVSRRSLLRWPELCLRRGRFLRSFGAVATPGVAGRAFLESVGVRPPRVLSPLYAIRPMSTPAPPEVRDGFIFVGALHPRKGFDTLGDAYRRYVSEGGTWALDAYGMGPLRPAAAPDAVQFHGFCDPEVVRQALAQAAVSVLPSRYDPWGVALAEGAAAGHALIASSRVGSAADLLTPGVNGFVVRAGDVSQLTESLHRAQALTSRRPSAVAAASVGAVNRFSPEAFAMAWRNTIERMAMS